MEMEDKEKFNTIDNLKKKLFSKNFNMKIGHHDSFSDASKKSVPENWENSLSKFNFEEIISKKTSMFKKFFIFSLIFFIIAAIYASYMIFFKGNTVSSDNIGISIFGNTFTAGGEELPLQIEIVNKNNSPLELAHLLIEYPKSAMSDLANDAERIRVNLGSIPAGGSKTENVKVIIFGEQGSVRPIKVSLEYRVEGSSAIFVKEKPYEVSISSAPIDLVIDSPTEASSNQDINFKIKATLNSTKSASKVLIKVDYPAGFEFTLANPAPSFGNNIWNLGDLSPGAENEISIIGKMIDVADGEEKSFHVFSGSQSDSDKSSIGVIFNSFIHTMLIKKPLIEAKLYINGSYQREYSSDSNSTISGEIRWLNNLDTKINDVEIKAKITGNAVNKAKIFPSSGYYDSGTGTISWDRNSSYDLSEIDPGDSGSVLFSLVPISLFSTSAGVLKDPSINIEVSILAKQAFDGNLLQEFKNSETKIIKIISDIGFTNKALYFSGPFANTGPIPPKFEEETTYTIVWNLFNTANSVSRVKIRSTLPQWVRFTGNFYPQDENLTYDPSTREVTWDVGNVVKGVGISGKDKEVSFQIALLPSLSQVNTAPTIINDAVLTGYDDFANVNVRVNKPSLSTRLSSDLSFPASGDRVIGEEIGIPE
jgi:hypothetical protein